MPLGLLQSLLGRVLAPVTEPPHVVTEPALPRTAIRPLPDLYRAECSGVEVVAFSQASPIKTTGNEDAFLIEELTSQTALFAVADGLGGHKGGALASQHLAERLRAASRVLRKHAQQTAREEHLPATLSPGALQLGITEAIEAANRSLLRRISGAATTLALVELHDGVIRPYHVGDSEVLVVGQRGRIKHRTVSHSPVGYAQHCGVLSESEALHAPDRHVVDNVIGMPTMRIELGPRLRLASRDTVLIASDGLFDNVWQEELIELIRKGPLEEAIRQLLQLVYERMTFPSPDQPSKPDDLTLIAFRLLKSERTVMSVPVMSVPGVSVPTVLPTLEVGAESSVEG